MNFYVWKSWLHISIILIPLLMGIVDAGPIRRKDLQYDDSVWIDAPPPSCTPTIKGHTYNFNSLKAADSENYLLKSDSYYYVIQICGESSGNSEIPDSRHFRGAVTQYKQSDKTKVAVCAYWQNLDEAEVTWQVLPAKDGNKGGVRLRFDNGDFCFSTDGDQERKATIDLLCDSVPKSEIKILAETPSCEGLGYHFEMRTCEACLEGCTKLGVSGLSTGSKLLIIMFLASMLYIGGGCYYNHRFHGSEYGRASFPHFSFWSNTLPLLVSDGIAFTRQRAGPHVKAMPGRLSECLALSRDASTRILEYAQTQRTGYSNPTAGGPGPETAADAGLLEADEEDGVDAAAKDDQVEDEL